MLTTNSVPTSDAAAVRPAVAPFRATARDLVALTKPRVTVIVMATGAAGMALAPAPVSTFAENTATWGHRALALAGMVLVVGAANALNMWWERDVDGLMARTKDRPLPAGRMGASAALTFGLVLGAIAVPMLFAVNAMTGWLGLFALLSYVAVYTPLKRITPRALEIGAVPGAIPPLMGWTSITGQLDRAGLLLFGLLFLWQLPHFIAISIFRAEDYDRAGMKVHAVAHGTHTSRLTIVASTIVLVGVSLLAAPFGLTHGSYLFVAMALGSVFSWLAIRGLTPKVTESHAATVKWSRQIFGFSIIYLVLLMGSLLALHPTGA